MTCSMDLRCGGSAVCARASTVTIAAASWLLATTASAAPPFTEITSGFDLNQNVRPALADNGTVVVAAEGRLEVGDGASLAAVDLDTEGLVIQAGSFSARALQVRNGGDVVFVANRPVSDACEGPGGARGAYYTDTMGSSITALTETCAFDTPDVGAVGPHIAMSPNGTVAFSQIVNGNGALYRGPAAGPVSVLRSGTGEFFNTQEIDVNDAGRVPVQMEYFDGFAGGLLRGILVFDTPEQAKADIDTAVEKLGIGNQPSLAINSDGIVAFATNSNFSMPIGGTTYNFDAGVYRADPTQFNTPKMLTLVADRSGDFCNFGRVDIDDGGTVVFEAQVVGELSGCVRGFDTVMDGIFYGPNITRDRIVVRGDNALEGHQFFDNIRLGELNNAGQLSFLTTYSEPLVVPTVVWRTEIREVRIRDFIDRLFARLWRIIQRVLFRFGG